MIHLLIAINTVLPSKNAAGIAGTALHIHADTTSTDPRVIASAVIDALRKNDVTMLGRFLPEGGDFTERYKDEGLQTEPATDEEKLRRDSMNSRLSRMVKGLTAESFAKIIADASSWGINFNDSFTLKISEFSKANKSYWIQLGFKSISGKLYKLDFNTYLTRRGLLIDNQIKLAEVK